MEHDPHTGFIVAAYALAAVVITVMVVAIIADGRSLRRSLKRFGPRGLDQG